MLEVLNEIKIELMKMLDLHTDINILSNLLLYVRII